MSPLNLFINILIKWKMMMIILIVFWTIGLAVAFLTPIKWKAKTSLILNTTKEGGALNSNLSGLAGLAGISIPGASKSNTILPEAYLDIIRTNLFARHLLSQKIVISYGADSIYYYEYINEIHDKSLSGFENFSTFDSLDFDKGEILSANEDEQKVFKSITESIDIDTDIKKNITIITANAPHQLVAPQIIQITANYLNSYLNWYSKRNLRKKMSFVHEQIVKKRLALNQAELSLAEFKDNNLVLTSNVAKTQLIKLESEYNLAFTLYEGVSQQYEQLKIEASEQLLTLQFIEEIKVPILRNQPRRVQIMIIFTFLGLLLTLLIIRFENDLKKSFSAIKDA